MLSAATGKGKEVLDDASTASLYFSKINARRCEIKG